MRKFVWEQLRRTRLNLDQTDSLIEFTKVEMEKYYYPLALRLLELGNGCKRLLVAVAGPPGSGKTVFTTLLVATINAELGSENAVLVQLDGWHYPNDYLDTHEINQNGKIVKLSNIKGSPETYDTKIAYQFLKYIKHGDQMSYPVYSRRLHNPIPDGGMMESKHQIAVIEGNYWLLQEDPWQRFQNLFDVRIFLSASREQLVDGLYQRHLRGGKTIEVTSRQIENVDLPNIDRVLRNSRNADVVVHKSDNRHITRVEYFI